MSVDRRFCPACGQVLERRFLEAEGRHRLICQANHILYENPVVVAGTLPVDNGRVWLLRRAIEPRTGFWSFPAGYMELGESVEEAATRETREEIGLDVQLNGLLDIYSRPEASAVFIVYRATSVGKATAQEEALEVKDFAPDEIPWDSLAFWSTKRALEDWVTSLAV